MTAAAATAMARTDRAGISASAPSVGGETPLLSGRHRQHAHQLLPLARLFLVCELLDAHTYISTCTCTDVQLYSNSTCTIGRQMHSTFLGKKSAPRILVHLAVNCMCYSILAAKCTLGIKCTR
eukprot:COSAG05_NODE_303_length_11737_cov_116.354270_13_plen_123_part_00